MSKQFSFGGQPCKVRCPKCRKQNLHISEVWDGNGIYFTIKNGVMPDAADDHFQGGPVCLESHCTDCDHRWTVRGITSIYDAVVDASTAAQAATKDTE